jgi:hypothetical protein
MATQSLVAVTCLRPLIDFTLILVPELVLVIPYTILMLSLTCYLLILYAILAIQDVLVQKHIIEL